MWLSVFYQIGLALLLKERARFLVSAERPLRVSSLFFSFLAGALGVLPGVLLEYGERLLYLCRDASLCWFFSCVCVPMAYFS